jgi:transposase
MDTATSNLPDTRQTRGLIIARDRAKAFRRIADGTLYVPSQTGKGGYIVELIDDSTGKCTCPDFEEHAGICKHQFASRYFLRLLEMPDGSNVVTESIKITYQQPSWPAYNRAQVDEKDCVQSLLAALCDGVKQPDQIMGRPRMPLGDLVYGAAMRVYTTRSARRAMSDIQACRKLGFVERVPQYNTIFKYLGKEEMVPLLSGLVTESARPLMAIERSFSPDATGFASPIYTRWIDHKHGDDKRVARQDWVKLHGFVGNATNVVVCAEVTKNVGAGTADVTQFETLVERAVSAGFDVDEIPADKGYLSRPNVILAERIGARAFIPMKTNSTKAGPAEWQRLYHLFALNRPAFDARYGKRQNVESSFSAIKRKFLPSVRSRNFTAASCEVLLKCLCFNLSMLVHTTYEMGIELPKFWLPKVAKS